MFPRLAANGCLALVIGHSGMADAAASQQLFRGDYGSSAPLSPEYTIDQDGSVTLRICFNWSCARKRTMTFTPDDVALLKSQMAICRGKGLEDRLQRVRIGIWQMELLAQKYLPSLANDLAINDFEAGVDGRTDCVDNATNTTTYLHILQGIQELDGWQVSSPKVRNLFDVTSVHWTAVIIDTESKTPWSVDSWYRPNGHLPMIMPLASWIAEKKGWEPPFNRMNATPHSVYDLCHQQPAAYRH